MKRFVLWIAVFLLFVGIVQAQWSTPSNSPGSGYYAVYQDYPNVALTGPTTETNLVWVKIPANTLGPNGVVYVTTLWSMTNSANNKTFTMRFSPTQGSTGPGGVITQTNFTTSAGAQGFAIMRMTGATNSQATFGAGLNQFTSNIGTPTTAAVDTTVDTYLNINGQLALGTENMTLLAYTIEVTRP